MLHIGYLIIFGWSKYQKNQFRKFPFLSWYLELGPGTPAMG